MNTAIFAHICYINTLYLIIRLILCMLCLISSNCVIALILSAFVYLFLICISTHIIVTAAKKVMWPPAFVCQQNSVMSYGEILMKFWENVVNGPRTIPLKVGDENLDFRGLSKIKANGRHNVLWRSESSLNAFFSSFYLEWSLKSRGSIASDC